MNGSGNQVVNNFRVVLMVDLSEPNSLWFTLESLMGALNSHLQHSIKVHHRW